MKAKIMRKLGRRSKMVLVVLIAVMFVSVASAALLTHYGQITTTVRANQSLWVDGQQCPKSENIIDEIPDLYPGGKTFCFPHLLDNRGSVPMAIELNPGCSGTDFDDDWINCDGITTTYWKVDTAPTIDGVINVGEWGESDFSGSDYVVYVLSDEEYLYVAFEADGGDFTIASSMTNIYIYDGDDYAGECWAYCAGAPDQVVGLTYFTTHHIREPKVKEGQESRTTSAIVEVSTLVTEWKIPLNEFTMDIGDTIAFDFMSFSEGISGWDTAWLYEQSCTIGTEIPKDTPFTMQPGEMLNFLICHGIDDMIYPGTYIITTTIK